MTQYLFRSPRHDRVFLSADDPSYRYTTCCGRCDYPVEASEPQCPRCQKQLTDCPACSPRNHRRPVMSQRSADGSIQCSLCHAMRHPIGHVPVLEMAGSFCTNIYGCPAGGMLTRHDEAILWSSETRICPICRSRSLAPKPARTFAHLVRRCLFCSSIFGLDSSWRTRLTDGIDHISEMADVAPSETPCTLCGRNDHRAEDGTIQVQVMDPWAMDAHSRPGIDENEYLHIAELAHALIIFSEGKKQAADHLFDLWTPPIPGDPGLTVGEAVEHLLLGTLDAAVRVELQRSIDGFMEHWEGLHLGLEHRLTPRQSPARNQERKPHGRNS